MGVKDDILNELSNIPLEVIKPADSTNYDQQQIEKDSWGRLLNTQTFKQFENSTNSSSSVIFSELLGMMNLKT